MVLIMVVYDGVDHDHHFDDSCLWWWWWWNLHFIRLTRPLGTFLEGVTNVFWCNCRAPLKTGTALQETQLPAYLSHPHRIQRNDHGLVADVLGNLFARRYAWVKSGVFPACEVVFFIGGDYYRLVICPSIGVSCAYVWVEYTCRDQRAVEL